MGAVADVKVGLLQTDYRSDRFGAREATYSLDLRSGARRAGTVWIELNAGEGVDLQIEGAGVTRPSAATWRVETRLGPGENKRIRVVARKQLRIARADRAARGH